MLLPGVGHIPSAYTSRHPVPRVGQGWQPQSSVQNRVPRPQVEAGREGAPSWCSDSAPPPRPRPRSPHPLGTPLPGEDPTHSHPAFIPGVFTSTFLPPFTISLT